MRHWVSFFCEPFENDPPILITSNESRTRQSPSAIAAIRSFSFNPAFVSADDRRSNNKSLSVSKTGTQRLQTRIRR